MKLKYLSFAFVLFFALSTYAGNEKKTVSQVTDAVTLTTNVDYIVNSTTPFATTGSINIENTEHAVIIFSKIKPSKVISQGLLKKIYINGQQAVAGDLTSKNETSGSNCQVKMYNRGTIIMPYGQKFLPLTCYTKTDFQGESCNTYTEGHSGGYMKTLQNATLNNNIRSFKLKRGYMVTFALGTSGWGYSRCFIADTEDLEMNLPENMAGKVSSYRLFKWWDASKAGIHDTSSGTNDALNTTSCFDWGQGNESLLPDVEWVPNHIYEDWPSSSTCGSVIGSCHMKTNNEPGNSSDDHPQDVETVLNNWQNLMRTGMRLCSESSHDGSMNHLKNFITEIDNRGWRCDILDLHCYWTGQFNNLDWYRSEYGNGRPIWISEWVYGSSWGNAGIFNNPPDGRDSYSNSNQQKNYDYVKPVLETLNNKGYIERYFYWNSEADCSKIYKNGQISILGKYYASMETGLGYNKKYEYVPKVVYAAPTDLTATYNKSNKTVSLSWKDSNGDMLDSLVVEYKPQGATKYIWLANIPLKDMSNKTISYSYTATPGVGANYYRIAAYPIGSKTAKYSDETSVTISSAIGNGEYQYGNITVTNTNAIETAFSESFSTTPAVFMGPITNANSAIYPGNLVTSVSAKKFSYQILPGQKGSSTAKVTLDKSEDIPFLALKDTSNYIFGALKAETGNAKVNVIDTTTVTFRQPFAEGVTPVVICELRNIGTSLKTNPLCIRIFDVNNTGFKAITMYEGGVNVTTTMKGNATMVYLAVEPGIGTLDQDNNLMIAAGLGDDVYGTTYRPVSFLNGEESLHFSNPYVFGTFQTLNYHSSVVARRTTNITVTEKESELYGFVNGTRIKRQVDASTKTTEQNTKAFGDTFGWIVISEYAEGGSAPTAIRLVSDSYTNGQNISIVNGSININGSSNCEVYSLSGIRIDNNSLNAGTYIIKSGTKTAKVVIR